MNIQTVTYNNVSLVSVTNPGELEIKYLKNNFGFDPLNLEDYINKTQVPKIEIYKNYSLVVLDFPTNGTLSHQPNVKDQNKSAKLSLGSLMSIPGATLSSVPVPLPQFSSPDKQKRMTAAQVYVFIGKDYVVVLDEGLLSPINEIFAECQKTLRNRNEYMSQGSVFLAYRIIDALVDACFSVMNDIASNIDRIDKELETKKSQSTIEAISLVRRNLVVFQTMIKPIIPLFKHLEEGKYKELNGSMQPFWSNILDHLQKIWDRLEDSRELIEGISESNESLLAYRNNEIVKFLTVITSIAFPFVIVNNLYSMNVVGLPYAQNPNIVWILFSIIFFSGVLIIIYFKFRKWI